MTASFCISISSSSIPSSSTSSTSCTFGNYSTLKFCTSYVIQSLRKEILKVSFVFTEN